MKPIIKKTYKEKINELDKIADAEARIAEKRHGATYQIQSADNVSMYSASTFVKYYHRAMNRLKRKEGLIS